MATRTDTATRTIPASGATIYRAFSEPGAMERWLPPGDMNGKMLHFDFREGGAYRLRLTYQDPESGTGKTSADSDEVQVRIMRLEPGKRIEQEAVFESDDPAFAGVMRMTWTLTPEAEGTRVTVRAENVPPGIRAEDHQAGLDASLRNLAAFVTGPAHARQP